MFSLIGVHDPKSGMFHLYVFKDLDDCEDDNDNESEEDLNEASLSDEEKARRKAARDRQREIDKTQGIKDDERLSGHLEKNFNHLGNLSGAYHIASIKANDPTYDRHKVQQLGYELAAKHGLYPSNGNYGMARTHRDTALFTNRSTLLLGKGGITNKGLGNNVPDNGMHNDAYYGQNGRYRGHVGNLSVVAMGDKEYGEALDRMKKNKKSDGSTRFRGKKSHGAKNDDPGISSGLGNYTVGRDFDKDKNIVDNKVQHSVDYNADEGLKNARIFLRTDGLQTPDENGKIIVNHRKVDAKTWKPGSHRASHGTEANQFFDTMMSKEAQDRLYNPDGSLSEHGHTLRKFLKHHGITKEYFANAKRQQQRHFEDMTDQEKARGQKNYDKAMEALSNHSKLFESEWFDIKSLILEKLIRKRIA